MLIVSQLNYLIFVCGMIGDTRASFRVFFFKLVNVFFLICQNAIMTSVRYFLIDMIDDTRASFDFALVNAFSFVCYDAIMTL